MCVFPCKGCLCQAGTFSYSSPVQQELTMPAVPYKEKCPSFHGFLANRWHSQARIWRNKEITTFVWWNNSECLSPWWFNVLGNYPLIIFYRIRNIVMGSSGEGFSRKLGGPVDWAGRPGTGTRGHGISLQSLQRPGPPALLVGRGQGGNCHPQMCLCIHSRILHLSVKIYIFSGKGGSDLQRGETENFLSNRHHT